MPSKSDDLPLVFRILGPLELYANGRLVPVPGKRLQLLLALLLLNLGLPVAADRLITGIWGSSAPRSAAAQLRICVSKLRRHLAAIGLDDVLHTKAPCYSLDVPQTWVDAHRFTALVHRAGLAEAERRPAEAVTLLRAALALWRGPALDGLTSRVVRAGAVRLDEERVAAMERCFDHELGLGRHAHIIPELMSCTESYLFREKLHCQLVLALYRSGRQVDALAACKALEERFSRELGIDPSPSLRTLHTMVLKHHPSLNSRAITPAAPRQLISGGRVRGG